MSDTTPLPRTAPRRTLLALAIATLSLCAAPFAAADRGDHGDRGDRGGHADRGGPGPRGDFRRGDVVRELPRDRRIVTVGRVPYYYGRGTYGRGQFWRQHGRDYVVVRPPIGAWVPFVPFGWVSFWIGPHRYFWVDDDYYMWEPVRREYVVVDKPAGADEALRNAKRNEDESTQVFAYPTRGQSAATADRDRYECHLWAVNQSGFDPAEPGERRDLIPDYRRAISACLEGRGYSVK